MSFGLSIIMSGIITAINTGLENNYFDRWFKSWTFAFPIALISTMMLSPIIRLLVDRIASKD